MNRYYINLNEGKKFRLYKFNKNNIYVYYWNDRKFSEVNENDLGKYPQHLDIQVSEIDVLNILCNQTSGINDKNLFYMIKKIYNYNIRRQNVSIEQNNSNE